MSPAKTYSVRVSKDYLVFCAGHFITFNGDHCERIHGHNYRVAVEVEDDLDENRYVFDFIALRDLTKALTDALDHRMLLPDRNPHIRVSTDGNNLRATYGDRYWSFPAEECVVLPIENTTAELLADHLADRLLEGFAERGLKTPRALTVEVDESFCQIGRVVRRLHAD